MLKRGVGKNLVRIFSAVGNTVFSVGASFQKIPNHPRRSTPAIKRQRETTDVFRVVDQVSDRNSQLWGDVANSIDKKLAKFSRDFKYLRRIGTDPSRGNIGPTTRKPVIKMIVSGSLVSIIALGFLFFLGVPFLFLIVGVSSAFLFTVFFISTYPKRKLNSRVAEVNRVLPYALRHMSTQLSSGIGLPETITSVSRAGYGVLSEEFSRVILDVNKGASFEEALARLDDRVPSEPLRKTTRQIRRALRTGGDLAKVLNVLADEAAFEMRMKLRDYTQSLNMITMIYMFVSAVIPAMLMITMNISSGIGRATISVQTAGVIYLVLLPLLLVYFVFMIKKLEPRL